MSIFCAFDGSIKSQILQRSRRSSSSMLLSTAQCISAERPVPRHLPERASVQTRKAPRQAPRANPFAELERCFISALVLAGQCERHSKELRSSQGLPIAVHRRRCLGSGTALPSTRQFSTKASPRHGSQAVAYAITQEEATNLLDAYSDPENYPGREEHVWQKERQRSVRAKGDTDTSSLPLDNEKPPVDAVSEGGKGNLELIDISIYDPLVRQLEAHLEDREASEEDIFDCYMDLPSPRMAYLSRRSRKLLFNRLGVVETKTEQTFMRFMRAFEDARALDKPVYKTDWNTAIHLAGTVLEKMSGNGLQEALSLWQQMEMQAGIKACNTTFNILFDIATKAGKFVLADMLYREMEHRGVKFDRYFRVGYIYYQGLKRSGVGVRDAYQQLVNSGEIIDTAVISCVMTALLNCGEPAAAEQLFERAKRLHAEKTDLHLPATGWRERRGMGKLLDHAMQASEEERAAIARVAPIAPDAKTYRNLMHFHIVAGNIDRVDQLRREMLGRGLQVSGELWMYYFRAFNVHGGSLYSSWTARSLEKTFEAFVRAVDDEKDPTHVGGTALKLVAKAYMQCTDESRTRAVLDLLLERCEPDGETLAEVEDTIAMWESRTARLHPRRQD